MFPCFVFVFLSLCHVISSSILPRKNLTDPLPNSEISDSKVHVGLDSILDKSFEMPNQFLEKSKAMMHRDMLEALGEKDGNQKYVEQEVNLHEDPSQKTLNYLNRVIRSKNDTGTEEMESLAKMDQDDILGDGFGKMNHLSVEGGPTQGSGDDTLIGTTSDYVLIAMIVAMMFCMTLCCLCLFCRSSSRLSICGINFELNDRRNSLNAAEDLSEIHEVLPLTPTTADNNRLPDIESILRADAPPPLYEDIVEKNSKQQKLERKSAVSVLDETKKTNTQGQRAKENEAKESSKSFKKKSRLSAQISVDRGSESSSATGRTSWKIPGRGILASFRAKSSIMRHRKSDSAITRPNFEEGAPGPQNQGSPTQHRREDGDVITMETVQEVVKETEEASEANREKVFVYDVSELQDDDDVFL